MQLIARIDEQSEKPAQGAQCGPQHHADLRSVDHVRLLQHVRLGEITEIHAPTPEHVNAPGVDARQQQIVHDSLCVDDVWEKKIQSASHGSACEASLDLLNRNPCAKRSSTRNERQYKRVRVSEELETSAAM